MKKFGILFVLLAGLATLIAGCGGQKAEGISADKKNGGSLHERRKKFGTGTKRTL